MLKEIKFILILAVASFLNFRLSTAKAGQINSSIQSIDTQCDSIKAKLGANPKSGVSLEVDDYEIEDIQSIDGTIRMAVANRWIMEDSIADMTMCFRSDGSVMKSVLNADSSSHTGEIRNNKAEITRYFDEKGKVVYEVGHEKQVLLGYSGEDGKVERVNGDEGKVEFDRAIKFPIPTDTQLKDLDLPPIMNSSIIKEALRGK